MEQMNKDYKTQEHYRRIKEQEEKMMRKEALSGVAPHAESVFFNPNQNPNERKRHWFFLDVR